MIFSNDGLLWQLELLNINGVEISIFPAGIDSLFNDFSCSKDYTKIKLKLMC